MILRTKSGRNISRQTGLATKIQELLECAWNNLKMELINDNSVKATRASTGY